MLPSGVEPSTAENVPVRGRDLGVIKASIPTKPVVWRVVVVVFVVDEK
jgi:hypothetical protein